MKLFAVYIGGDLEGANIELHDMRFVVADSLAETYGELRRQWWGIPKSLHIDCWAELTVADGYAISLKPTPYEGVERLYYVNLGGYDRSEFLEKHKNAFVVAQSAPEARKRALTQVKDWYAPHKDEMYEAEQMFDLDQEAQKQRWHIHLESVPHAPPFQFTCEYRPIALRAKRDQPL